MFEKILLMFYRYFWYDKTTDELYFIWAARKYLKRKYRHFVYFVRAIRGLKKLV